MPFPEGVKIPYKWQKISRNINVSMVKTNLIQNGPYNKPIIHPPAVNNLCHSFCKAIKMNIN